VLAGKQPWAGVGDPFGDPGAAGGQQRGDVAGEGFGQLDGGDAERDGDLAGCGIDGVDAEPADAVWALPEQQDQQAGDPVGGSVAGLVQQRAGQIPSLVVVGGRCLGQRLGSAGDGQLPAASGAVGPGQKAVRLRRRVGYATR
jgi:hypothetical protein